MVGAHWAELGTQAESLHERRAQMESLGPSVLGPLSPGALSPGPLSPGAMGPPGNYQGLGHSQCPWAPQGKGLSLPHQDPKNPQGVG